MGAVGGTILDFTPIIGDAKGFYDAYQNPTPINIAAAFIGLAPGVGDAAAKVLKGADRLADAAKGARAAEELAGMSGMMRDAASGKGNFGIGSGTGAQADAMGAAWVGSNPVLASDGKTLVSADGLRQYRPPSAKPNSPHASTGVQANFEQRTKPKGEWQSNAHLDIE